MNRINIIPPLVLCGIFMATTFSVSAARVPHRPPIWRIAQVSILSSDTAASHAFYEKLLPGGHVSCNGCAKVPYNAFMVNWGQTIYLSQASSVDTPDLVSSIAFATDDLRELRRYLLAQGINCNPPPTDKFADTFLSILDPEKHTILFLKQPRHLEMTPAPKEKLEIIHAGLIVHDRPAMEHFYKDILGFRPYWHGGRKDDGVDDWVSFQVPDGTDWIEFMLNVPDNANKHLLGVMNHIALGVTDIQATKAHLIKNGAQLTEEPKIGRDGKWQLNLYDPDDTRIEFMEFIPKGKTCCSEFTGPHPKP